MSSQIQTADIAMLDTSLDQPLFEQAIQAIQNTVLAEHHQNFHPPTNAALLLDELRQVLSGNGPDDQRLSTCSRKLSFFVRTFAPYFDILGTCMRVRPEWISWFWGAVRLVFKIGSNYMLFLEKIVDVFETITHIIPSYNHIYEVCKRNTSDSSPGTEDHHLAKLMSYVFADLVQLCLELYCIFCRGVQGTGSRFPTSEPITSTLWRPFDSRFSRLEARLAHHRRWLEKETQHDTQNFADVVQHRETYLGFLYRESFINRNDRAEHEDQRLVKRVKRVEKIQTWLSGSPAVDMSDSSHEQQHANSCAWFLQMPAYCKWRDQLFDPSTANDRKKLKDTWQHRVLFVQAKAGFGKTFISNTVIDNLVAETEDPAFCDEPPVTASYQFGHPRSESYQADDAFRTIVHQLLTSHRYDRLTLDTVCLLLRKTSFREHATTSEVLEVLSLLLRQHPTFLVVDGIQECSDINSFLATLARLCIDSDARVILFSRPNLKIPLEYQKWASDAPHILSLRSEHNAVAIEQHVVQVLNRMADRGYFGISMDRNLILGISRIADGEFLWASMLLKFLQSPILSSKERLAILENIQTLQGLDSLYGNMLGALARRSQYEKSIIADTFRWLSFPIHSLCAVAMHSALSVVDPTRPGKIHPNDLINALPELTLGLIQVPSSNTISFAHESIREYLRSPLSQGSEFSLYDESSVHAHLAARCLPYLAYDIPKQPLAALQPHASPTIPPSSGASQRTNASGDSGYKSLSSAEGDTIPSPPAQTSIPTIPFDTHLPFLRYASLCWPIHLSRALSTPSPYHASPTILSYLPALRAFLSCRLAVTVWVEASFRYNLPPTLTRLVGPLSDLKGEFSPGTVAGRDLRIVVSDMRILSERLVQLKREWEGELRANASLIWQVREAEGKTYWPVWEDIDNGAVEIGR